MITGRSVDYRPTQAGNAGHPPGALARLTPLHWKVLHGTEDITSKFAACKRTTARERVGRTGGGLGVNEIRPAPSLEQAEGRAAIADWLRHAAKARDVEVEEASLLPGGAI